MKTTLSAAFPTRSKATNPGRTATPIKGSSRRSRATLQPDSPSNAIDCPREQMIAEAAYFRAERRGFTPGNEMSDWLEAEADVEHLLTGRH